MNRVGIVVAMVAEARSLTREHIATEVPIPLREGPLIYVSGIGPRRAGIAAKALLREGVAGLVSWGSAGGLVERLSAGSLILPKNVISADQSVYQGDADWHDRLYSRLKEYFHVHTEPLAESTGVLTGPVEKRRLSTQTGAIAADMESASVALAAQEAGLPFMAIRVVLDPLEVTIPFQILNAVDEFGRVNVLKLAIRLLRYPGEWLTLYRMSRNLKAVQTILSAVVKLTGTNLLVS